MVNLTIDNQKISVAEGMTILDAANSVNVIIPTLCHLAGLTPTGSCGICAVEIEGERTNTRSCVRMVQEGMKVHTNTTRLRNHRKMLIELLLAHHPTDCFTCDRTKVCELRDLAYELGVRSVRFDRTVPHRKKDDGGPSIVRDPDKCILCGRCVRVCEEIQTVGAVDFANRGDQLVVTTGMNKGLNNVECVNCGQCIHVCPVSAISEVDNEKDVWNAIDNPDKYVVVQEAPAIRAGLGEELGLAPGSLVTGKMHAALKILGFDTVFDTNFTADLTIMEEGSELVKRIRENGVLPMFTSCCPGWVKFLEHFYPELLPHLSTCKSPQQMFGALAKTYFAGNAGINPEKMVSVSIMPCTAKKYEALRPEMKASGQRDVDFVLTTRELARMIREAGIDFENLKEEQAEELMGAYSGAATIFGATGGVMEAALRTAYRLITGKELEAFEIEPVRGMEGIKKASVKAGNLDVNVAVAHGLANARKLVEEVKTGKSPYHLIEVMACPGGCVGGGGQPIGFNMNLRKIRGQALYSEDKSLSVRKSHLNPAITRIYLEFLEKPLGERSHKLLHTTYTNRAAENKQVAAQRGGI
jgi:NADH-quinone oxidoreductase subunit G